jgi:hypothetical protein
MQVTFNAKERTLREIVALALSAGWKVTKVTRAQGSLFGHILAVPVDIPAREHAGAEGSEGAGPAPQGAGVRHVDDSACGVEGAGVRVVADADADVDTGSGVDDGTCVVDVPRIDTPTSAFDLPDMAAANSTSSSISTSTTTTTAETGRRLADARRRWAASSSFVDRLQPPNGYLRETGFVNGVCDYSESRESLDAGTAGGRHFGAAPVLKKKRSLGRSSPS